MYIQLYTREIRDDFSERSVERNVYTIIYKGDMWKRITILGVQKAGRVAPVEVLVDFVALGETLGRGRVEDFGGMTILYL